MWYLSCPEIRKRNLGGYAPDVGKSTQQSLDMLDVVKRVKLIGGINEI
jgi:hypothetical protein